MLIEGSLFSLSLSLSLEQNKHSTRYNYAVILISDGSLISGGLNEADHPYNSVCCEVNQNTT